MVLDADELLMACSANRRCRIALLVQPDEQRRSGMKIVDSFRMFEHTQHPASSLFIPNGEDPAPIEGIALNGFDFGWIEPIDGLDQTRDKGTIEHPVFYIDQCSAFTSSSSDQRWCSLMISSTMSAGSGSMFFVASRNSFRLSSLLVAPTVARTS